MRKTLAVALLIVSAQTYAACTWEWDCTTGQCRQAAFCENKYDIVPPKPAEIAPIPQATIKPIYEPVIPPPGAGRCAPKYLCNTYGECNWETTCR